MFHLNYLSKFHRCLYSIMYLNLNASAEESRTQLSWLQICEREKSTAPRTANTVEQNNVGFHWRSLRMSLL